MERLASYIDQIGQPETIEQAIAERDAWVESAAMFSRNEDYYRGLLDQIAELIGYPEAWTAENGDVYPKSEGPVRAALPDLVRARLHKAH